MCSTTLREMCYTSWVTHISVSRLWRRGDYYNVDQVDAFFWGDGQILPLRASLESLERVRCLLVGGLLEIPDCTVCQPNLPSRQMRGVPRRHVLSTLAPSVACDLDHYVFELGCGSPCNWDPVATREHAVQLLTPKKMQDLPFLLEMVFKDRLRDELSVGNLRANMQKAQIGPLLLGAFVKNQHPDFEPKFSPRGVLSLAGSPRVRGCTWIHPRLCYDGRLTTSIPVPSPHPGTGHVARIGVFTS